MKNSIIVVSFLLAFSFFVTGQNCKYKNNGIDKFTNQYVKLTKSEKVFGTFTTSGSFSAKKVDTSYFFIFDYSICSYSDFDPYSIQQGASLSFLLENGSIITLYTGDNIKGAKSILATKPPMYICELPNVSYPISKNEVDLFLRSKVKTIRFYRSESNGKEDYIDNELKKKNQDDIQNLIRCIL